MAVGFFYKGHYRHKGRSAEMFGMNRNFYREGFFEGECVG